VSSARRIALGWLVVTASLLAQLRSASASGPLSPAEIRRIGIEQRLDEQLPLDLFFRDEAGQPVRLSEAFGERPVILAFVYYQCPMLCSQVLHGLLVALKTLSFDAGKDYTVLALSFDPTEQAGVAAQKRASTLERYGRPGAEPGFRFFTGDAPAIDRVTEAAGFRYEYDEQLGQYAHGSAIMVLTPEGRLARYFYGTEYSPRDLRFALVEASDGRIGSPTDDLMLLCYRYDPQTGTYSAAAVNAVRVGGVLTALALAAFVGTSLRRERRRLRAAALGKRRAPAEGGAP
jgi:protein SCO1